VIGIHHHDESVCVSTVLEIASDTWKHIVHGRPASCAQWRRGHEFDRRFQQALDEDTDHRFIRR
jgi:hypothetical protein